MKKIIIIVIPIIIISALCYLLWWYDDTKIIEKPIVEGQQKAYSIKETENTVIFTIYTNFSPRIITTYYFKNGVVDHATAERIHINKKMARWSVNLDSPKVYNIMLKGNVVSGSVDSMIGELKDNFAKQIDEAWSKVGPKIE